MIVVNLSRRNLRVLLSKLDRATRGDETLRTIIKMDQGEPIQITAHEDADYYKDRNPGDVLPADDPKGN